MESQTFSHLSDLPAEIRLLIWQFAAPRRSRIIQIAYDPNKCCWTAWKDGLGGLPSIVHVSREARGEALKPYSRIFDAYVDLEEDTIFITDPIFSIRKPRDMFMSSTHANQLRKVAFTSEIYNGLAQSFDQFPSLCEAPVTVLRKLEGLTHFTLGLSEDGAGFGYLSDEDDEEGVNGENKEELNQTDAEESTTTLVQDDGSNTVQVGKGHGPEDGEASEEPLDEESVIRRFLDHLDEEAMEIMSKGFFRHLGNIHFRSGVGHPEHWEAWELYTEELRSAFVEEKAKYPDWTRPEVSVMAVAYGLNRLRDFTAKVHLMGDHSEDIFPGGEMFERSASGYTSETEEGDLSGSGVDLWLLSY